MKRIRVAILASVVVAVALLVGAFTWESVSGGQGAVTYTVNGLPCPIPASYTPFESVVRLLPSITQSERFANLANGSRYVFGNAENITDRTEQIGNQPPVHLPDVLEMVFYGFGPSTHCGESQTSENQAQNTIVVQVPLQNGAFNLTGATYHLGYPGDIPAESP